jgi:glutathione-independent formaldehyde dehydrogenase
MTITRTGGALGIPGLYVTDDPGGVDSNARTGTLGIRIGLGWAKSHTFATGQCPVIKYNRQLMMAVLHEKIQIAKASNVTAISLDAASQGYKDFDQEAAKKFVIDPHRMLVSRRVKLSHFALRFRE